MHPSYIEIHKWFLLKNERLLNERKSAESKRKLKNTVLMREKPRQNKSEHDMNIILKTHEKNI